MSEIAKPKNPDDDWKVWMVVNPSTWLMPILMAVLTIVLVIHASLFLMGFGFQGPAA